MKFSEAFSGLTTKSVIGLFIVAAGLLVVGKPVLMFLSQVLALAANSLPAVFH
jgi:hypothetical protein